MSAKSASSARDYERGRSDMAVAALKDEPLDTPVPAERVETTQDRVETTQPAKGVDSLDLLLAEYDQGTQAPPEQPQQVEQSEPPLDPLAESEIRFGLERRRSRDRR